MTGRIDASTCVYAVDRSQRGANEELCKLRRFRSNTQHRIHWMSRSRHIHSYICEVMCDPITGRIRGSISSFEFSNLKQGDINHPKLWDCKCECCHVRFKFWDTCNVSKCNAEDSYLRPNPFRSVVYFSCNFCTLSVQSRFSFLHLFYFWFLFSTLMPTGGIIYAFSMFY